MGIKVWRLNHSPYFIEDKETKQNYNKHTNVQNLGFTIEFDQQTIFHGGDWVYDGASPNPLEAGKIDVAFLSVGASLRLLNPDNRAMDKSRLPGNIILMHLYLPGSLEGLAEEEKNRISKTTVFKSRMEIKSFGE